jgi:hypothetical protein
MPARIPPVNAAAILAETEIDFPRAPRLIDFPRAPRLPSN